MKRSAIYIRVSTEQQSEKVSPQAQEADCIEYCQNRGYQVVDVYRDIEKYWVGGRMIEPSGTRADRPQFRRMLKDARANVFDVVIAWREDRLYRSYRPMLDVTDTIDETGIDIELVKETFDKKIAPVKAWAAKMELDARHDRVVMGIAGRLASGKASLLCSSPPYGYDYDKKNSALVINENEAAWVLQIWRWFGEGVAAYEIRRRLISEGVPQKGKKPRRYSWHVGCVKSILNRDSYYTGSHTLKWDGQNYQISIPPILDEVTYQMVKVRKASWKAYPAGNYKQYALAAGVVYCAACRVRMGVVRVNNGAGKLYSYYRCNNSHDDCSLLGCAHTVRQEKVDAAIWQKVWDTFSKPEKFERLLRQRIEELRSQEQDAEVDCKRLERELDEISLERQKVITWARKGFITESDLEVQLIPLTNQENERKHELREKRLLIGNRAEKLIEYARSYAGKVINGAVRLDKAPITPEEEALHFEIKRDTVTAIVTRVDIQEDGTPIVSTDLDLSDDCVICNKDIASMDFLW
jgi:site-specific DNA recombinase